MVLFSYIIFLPPWCWPSRCRRGCSGGSRCSYPRHSQTRRQSETEEIIVNNLLAFSASCVLEIFSHLRDWETGSVLCRKIKGNLLKVCHGGSLYCSCCFSHPGAGISLIFAYYPLSVRHRNIDDPSQGASLIEDPEKVIYCRKQFANKKEIMIFLSFVMVLPVSISSLIQFEIIWQHSGGVGARSASSVTF